MTFDIVRYLVAFANLDAHVFLESTNLIFLSIHQSLLKSDLISQALRERYLTQVLHTFQLFTLFV